MLRDQASGNHVRLFHRLRYRDMLMLLLPYLAAKVDKRIDRLTVMISPRKWSACS